jgi:PAS domain S-box-containing protein
MPRPLQILMLEDQPADAELVVRELGRAGFEFEWKRVDTETDYINCLRPDLDVILSDYSMPEFSALKALEVLEASGLEIPFIIISGTIGEDMAVAAMKKGAADYLLKDRLTRLGPAIHQALKQGQLRRERRHAESVLRESERRFREMLENVELIAMTLDKQGTVTFCNDYLLEVTGWERDEVIGSDWFSKFLPAELEAKRVFLETMEKGTVQTHLENSIQTKDGKIRDIAWSNTMLRDGAGGILGTASIGEDVTERKRAEERVHELAAMLDRAHDAIVVRGFYDRKISFWNKGAEMLYGWTVAEATGKDVGELICVDPVSPDAIRDELLTSDEWRGETQHKTRSGKILTMNTRSTLVRDANGEPISVLSINTDITEQKNLEARFLRAQRMESIGTLASGVAHDLNNILAPIMMSVPVLRRELNEAQREEIISTIEMSAERGAQIIKQVLTFGRGLEGERCSLQAGALIREMMKIMRGTFPKNLAIECSIEPELWPVVGDATQLHQVLLNLCVNARDAMPDGGKLRISARNLDLDASYASMLPEAKSGPYVLIEVSDTGTGIPAEIVERIFDPFFTTKGVGKGTGLGLSTVLGIVKSHGGFIVVNSQPGKGTTFQVYFPSSPEGDGASSDLARDTTPDGKGELILVVDDEASVRDAVRISLETAGYRALLASDGTEALALFAMNSGSIAAVLTDLMMPYMDGTALIRALRALTPSMPIIASTGLGEKVQLADLKVMNVATVLHKPYGAETLLRTIYETLHPHAN